MEPIVELSTRVTSLLWNIWALRLKATDATIESALNADWGLEFTRGAQEDFSRFQALLDLTGLTGASDWDQNDPLQQFALDDERAPGMWLRVIPNYRTRWKNRELRRSRYDDLRKLAIAKAIQVMRDRVSTLAATGLVAAIDDAGSSAALTREELFERVAAWAFGPRDSNPALRRVAEGFLGAGDSRHPLLWSGRSTKRHPKPDGATTKAIPNGAPRLQSGWPSSRIRSW